jgi:uncharacterized membrane protein
MTLPPEAYLWFKTLHIVGVVVWFAGLFYLVRLFIYHVETAELEPSLQQPFRDQYTLMEKRLANIITTPGMVVAVTDGHWAAGGPAELAPADVDARQAWPLWRPFWDITFSVIG